MMENKKGTYQYEVEKKLGGDPQTSTGDVPEKLYHKHLYPETWFVADNNGQQQLEHIMSEIKEINEAGNIHKYFEEVLDLQHSVETLVRICIREGMDLEHMRAMVKQKNKDRGYYTGRY